MRHGEVQDSDARRSSEFKGRCVEHHARRTRVIGRHFYGTPRRRADANPERLQHGLFRGEARREPFGLSVGVTAFAVGEEAFGEPRVTFESQRKSSDVHEVDSDVLCRHYSTVTVFAKLRGRSMLRPSPLAMAYAKSCKGTTSTMGENIGSVAGTRST